MPQLAHEKNIIIHVGTYKTASSSIQNLLYHNHKILKSLGVLYPETGLVRSEEIGHRHRQLITNYMQGKTNKYVPEALHKEIETSDCQTVILSCEAWSQPVHLAHLGGMVTELTGDFGATSGIAFFRNLSEYQVSHYREWNLRNSNKLTYRDYIKQPIGVFDYLHLAKHYRSLFGYRMNFIKFEPKVIDPVTAFINKAGISNLAPKLIPTTIANQQKLSALEIEIYRQINSLNLQRNLSGAFIQHMKEKNPDLFKEKWTERITDELPSFSNHYRRHLADIMGWPLVDVDSLFETSEIKGHHVSKVRGLINASLQKWLRNNSLI